MIREPTAPKRKTIPSSSVADKGKGKVVEEPVFDSDDEVVDLTQIPFEYWPKE